MHANAIRKTGEVMDLSLREGLLAMGVPPEVMLEGEGEMSLARRFNRPKLEEVVFEFTNDPALLHQYYRLRVDMYRHVHGVVGFNYEPDEYDRMSHILIARVGKLCIGGARITVREPDEEWLLPMEHENFKLRDVFPQYELHRHLHGEASRFALLEDYNNKDVLYTMCSLINRKTQELGLEYGFCRSPMVLARTWKRITNAVSAYRAEIAEESAPNQDIDDDFRMYLLMFKKQHTESAVLEVDNRLATVDLANC